MFEESTYNHQRFRQFVEKFAESSVEGLPIPSHFNHETIIRRYQSSLSTWSADYEKAVEAADPKEPASINRTMKKARDAGVSGWDELVSILRKDDFPPVLWIEFRWAKRAYLDSLEFMRARMEKWFKLAPRYNSQRQQRSKMTQAMFHPFERLFSEFARSMFEFSKMLLFIEVWSCNREDELFTTKPWSLQQVDKTSFDKAFEEVFRNFHQSMLMLRQTYFATTNREPDTSAPESQMSVLFRELVKDAEVS